MPITEDWVLSISKQYYNIIYNIICYIMLLICRYYDRRTKKSFTINYDASPSFVRAVVPGIQKYDNGTISLEWENYGRFFFVEGCGIFVRGLCICVEEC